VGEEIEDTVEAEDLSMKYLAWEIVERLE